jgi:hypothetical protein
MPSFSSRRRATPSDRSPPSEWRREPFRVFFPLAIVLGWAGVGQWLLYATGVSTTYSCYAHGSYRCRRSCRPSPSAFC